MSGNVEAVEIILQIDPQIKVEPLPIAYSTKIPQTAIYYLDAFLKADAISKQVSVFELCEGEAKETKIDDIKLASHNPILIKLDQRPVILAPDLLVEVANNGLGETLKLAAEHNVSEVVFNIDSMKYSHTVTAKLSKDANNLWNVVIIDPNTKGAIIQDFANFVGSALKSAGVNFKISPANYRLANERSTSFSPGVIIPNYASKTLAGYCDVIGSMVAASLIIGDDHSQSLRKFCVENGANCVEKIGEKLTPKIDEVMKKKMSRIKGNPNPSVSILAATLQKTQAHNEL
jgi:hypothetical protein